MFEVLKYIHENIKENFNLGEVAQYFGYSKWHFCSKFHEYTGMSFVKYVRYYRIQLAAQEIISGKKVTEVALEFGYDTPGGFNKAFLSEYGCLPREYKQKAKETKFYFERRRLSMYQLSDRCESLRQLVTGVNDYEDFYCVQHKVYYKLGLLEGKKAGLSRAEIVATGLSNILEKFTPVIIPGEVIVGFNFPDTKYHEYYSPENADDPVALMKKNGISDEDIRKFKESENEPFLWQGRLPEDYPEEKKKAFAFTEEETNSNKEWAAIGRCIDSNHTVLGYEKVLKSGFSGILKEVEEAESMYGEKPLYKAMKKICKSACMMGKKYANAAKALKDNPDYIKKDLDIIIKNCERVPEHGAENLYEAVQALWFAHIINTWEDYINANSLGRLDQILYPYYKADIDKGIITKEEAFEVICLLWIKLYRNYDVQQSCVGGTDAFGNSQVNDLSYLMLDATEQLDFVRCLSVRFSKNTEKEFLQRALEVVGHVQKGVPFFFNDDCMIPALISRGVKKEDAYDYTQIGCVETVIPGKSNPHAVTGENNLLKAIEYVFANGESMMYPGMKTGVKTGELSELDTYEKFYDAILKQIYHILDLCCSTVKKTRDVSAIAHHLPYKSLLTQGCIESGRDFNDAGALYDYYQIMLCGVPNLADSLEVIKKFVYRDKKYTLSELKEILVNDFPDESVRLDFINKAAKFGNNIESVDKIAADIIDKSCDYLDEFSTKYGLSFHAQPFTYLWMIEHGRETVATPDGRRKGEVIAYSVSPMQGRDFNGLTAVLSSIASLPSKRTPGTTSAIVEVDPKLFCDHNIWALTTLLMTAGEKGLANVQFNTVDAETLRDAKKNPDKHKNLAVRVSGFSQRFNLISPELQDHIIERTKHSCI